jgi:hypothetical protein
MLFIRNDLNVLCAYNLQLIVHGKSIYTHFSVSKTAQRGYHWNWQYFSFRISYPVNTIFFLWLSLEQKDAERFIIQTNQINKMSSEIFKNFEAEMFTIANVKIPLLFLPCLAKR